MKQRITDWLIGQGWSVKHEETPETNWAIVAESRKHVKVNVRQPVGRADQAVIFTTIQLDDETRQRIMRLSEGEREGFLWDIRFQLLHMGVEFEGIADVPERITVVLAVYADGLTKDSFFQRVSQIHSATFAAIWMVARKFAQPPPERTMGFEVPE